MTSTSSKSATEFRLLPFDDSKRSFSDSLLPESMIEAGEKALDKADLDLQNYVSGKTIDWDNGMIAVAVYRAMTMAYTPPPSSDTEARMREIERDFWLALNGREPRADFDDLVGIHRVSEVRDALHAAMLRARNEAINQAAAIVDDYVTPDAEIPEERGNKRLAVLVVNETANDIATTIRQLKDTKG